jgi:hypothetical protein
MDNHNIDWMMLAVIVEVTLIAVCQHFQIGVTTGGINGALPGITGTNLDVLHWFYTAMTFGLTGGGGIFLTLTLYFLNFVILWCIIPLIIAAVQALATFIP